MKSKERWRVECQGLLTTSAGGKVAEMVRQLDEYRQSRQLFVSPDPALEQVRINVLLDGKELIVPGPGLKEGFYRLCPFKTGHAKLAMAVSLRGIPTCGQLLPHQELPKLSIGMLIAEALAVDAQGNRLGDGSGFFDLACAILQQCGALVSTPSIWAAALCQASEPLPIDPWDVRMSGLLGPDKVVRFPLQPGLLGIDWQQLSRKRIKKLTPLWKEWQKIHPPAIEGAESE